MLGRYTTGPRRSARIVPARLHARQHAAPRLSSRGVVGPAERLDKGFLAQRQGEIAARLLEDAARAVGGAAQAARQRIRVVQRDQKRVDVVHRAQELLAALDLTSPQ